MLFTFPLSGSSWQSLIFMVVFFLVIHVAKSQFLYKHTHTHNRIHPHCSLFKFVLTKNLVEMFSYRNRLICCRIELYWWICSMPCEFLSATSNTMNDSLILPFFLLILSYDFNCKSRSCWNDRLKHRQRRGKARSLTNCSVHYERPSFAECTKTLDKRAK